MILQSISCWRDGRAVLCSSLELRFLFQQRLKCKCRILGFAISNSFEFQLICQGSFDDGQIEILPLLLRKAFLVAR